MAGRSAGLIIRHRLLALALLGFVLYVPFLGLHDMWYPDEPDIAEICQRMVTSGDWIAPRLNGQIFVDYPPLLYWAGAVSAQIFGGISEFALRLPNALAAIGIALATCAAGSRWFGPPVGLWAGFLILSFQQFFLQAVGYRPDVLFTVGVAGGTFVYAAGCGDRPRWLLRAAGFALFGVALLAKGPLGLLLPGLVLALWHASRREWRRLVELAPLAVVALAVYLPWFSACARAMGSDDILYELYAQNVARFFGGDRGHAQPIYYYLVSIWGDLFPWSLALPFALGWLWQSGLRRDRHAQLAAWWLGAWFVFLSVAVTKRQLYLLPAYPAAALLLGPWIAGVTGAWQPAGVAPPSPRPARLAAGWIAALWLVLAAVALAAPAATGWLVPRLDLNPLELEIVPALSAPLVLTGLVALASAAWLGLAWRRGDVRAGLLRIGVSHLALCAVALGAIMPALNPVRSYKPQARWVREHIGSETRFGFVNTEKGKRKVGGFVLYSGGVLGQLMTRRDEVERFFAEHPRSVVLVLDKSWDALFGDQAADWRTRIVRELWVTHDRYYVVGGARVADSGTSP